MLDFQTPCFLPPYDRGMAVLTLVPMANASPRKVFFHAANRFFTFAARKTALRREYQVLTATEPALPQGGMALLMAVPIAKGVLRNSIPGSANRSLTFAARKAPALLTSTLMAMLLAARAPIRGRERPQRPGARTANRTAGVRAAHPV